MLAKRVFQKGRLKIITQSHLEPQQSNHTLDLYLLIVLNIKKWASVQKKLIMFMMAYYQLSSH